MVDGTHSLRLSPGSDASSALASGASSRPDRIERIPLGLRWINDAFDVAPTAGGFAMNLVDMTQAKLARRILREANLPATITHLLVRACALALDRNPHLHQTVCGYDRVTPGSVDIGLSQAGQTTYAPVVVLPRVNRRALSELVPEIMLACDAAMERELVDLAAMRRWLWIVPFGFLRRFVLRRLSAFFGFRKRLVGTFQVSVLPVDCFAPFLFYSGSVLAAGALRDRVVAVDGHPVVRPTTWLSLCADHGSLDGSRAAELLEAIQAVLEGDELVGEARDALRRAGRPANDGDPSRDASGAVVEERGGGREAPVVR
ncbi:MAG TPA: 2-oxo acid dehydrogenase subunit E2 [Polyangiaceae bacterium]